MRKAIGTYGPADHHRRRDAHNHPCLARHKCAQDPDLDTQRARAANSHSIYDVIDAHLERVQVIGGDPLIVIFRWRDVTDWLPHKQQRHMQNLVTQNVREKLTG